MLVGQREERLEKPVGSCGAAEPCPAPAVAPWPPQPPRPASLRDLLFLEHQKLRLTDKADAGPR